MKGSDYQRQLWDDWINAEVYREYVECYPLYRDLNDRIAQLADLGSARRVLDLGCGTGATTAACLQYLSDDAEVVALDFASAMVEVARCYASDPRACFVCADVSDLASSRPGHFDRVVCNAALWLFPNLRSVLGNLRSLLKPGGLLVFNLPAERIQGEVEEPHPFQVALGTSRMAHLRDWRPPIEKHFAPRDIEETLEQCDFQVENVMSYRPAARQRELMALMSIPAMAARLVPHLDREDGLQIVRSAAVRSDPDLEIDVPWIYFVASC